MKNLLQKITMVTCIYVATLAPSKAQNWQYVGNPYLNQTTSMFDYLYFGDLEFNAAGDAFVGYWEYTQELRFVKYTGGAWTTLPSPGTAAVSNIDIEVKGNNYYMAYSGVRGANTYVFVKKFNGTSWQQLGDSLLLGNSGSGGYFEFLLDNNEVPTLLGVVATPLLADKQIMQFNGSAWVNYYTLIGSNPTVFQESSAIFNSQNQLFLSTQGFVTSPTVTYINIVHKIDAGVRTTVGDTLFMSSGNPILKLDGTETPHLTFNNVLLSKVMAYKLNGNAWSFIADTSGVMHTMLNADLTSNGKMVFNTQFPSLIKSVFIYENNVKLQMDSFNIQGMGIGAITDLVIPAGSNDVYALILEIKTGGAQDFSVMKHSITGSNSLKKMDYLNTFEICPNPSNGSFTVNQNNLNPNSILSIYDPLGNLIYATKFNQTQHIINLNNAAKGLYFIKIENEEYQYQQKLIID
jgi:hypothetical protein